MKTFEIDLASFRQSESIDNPRLRHRKSVRNTTSVLMPPHRKTVEIDKQNLSQNIDCDTWNRYTILLPVRCRHADEWGKSIGRASDQRYLAIKSQVSRRSVTNYYFRFATDTLENCGNRLGQPQTVGIYRKIAYMTTRTATEYYFRCCCCCQTETVELD